MSTEFLHEFMHTRTHKLIVWNLSTFKCPFFSVFCPNYSAMDVPILRSLHIKGQMNGTSLLFVFLTHNLWLVIKISTMCLPIPFCTGISSSVIFKRQASKQATRRGGKIEICLRLRALRIEQYKKFVLQNRSANVSYRFVWNEKRI